VVDTVTKTRRSEIMSRVRGKDTGPELVVRRLVHAMGYRFRLHRKDLPGTPDLVFPRLHSVIFVHGCFWHRHPGCKRTRTPKSRTAYWAEKFERNVQRDRANRRLLRQGAWRVLTIWECETVNPPRLEAKLRKFLDQSSESHCQNTVRHK